MINVKYDRTNHDQIMKAREHFYHYVHKKSTDLLMSDDLKFEKWLWETWGVRYQGWGGHMRLEFENTEHEVLFRLMWS